MKTMLALCVAGFAAVVHAEIWNGKALITFDGTSTLHNWSGVVSAQPFQADVSLENGKPQRIVSTVTVKAAEMDTKEAKRDENMRKAMEVTQHPLIIGKIATNFGEVAGTGTPTALPMQLTLLGKPQQVTGKISHWKLDGDKATFDLEFPVSLQTSGITVPSVLHFIRVGDVVKVRASVTLTK